METKRRNWKNPVFALAAMLAFGLHNIALGSEDPTVTIAPPSGTTSYMAAGAPFEVSATGTPDGGEYKWSLSSTGGSGSLPDDDWSMNNLTELSSNDAGATHNVTVIYKKDGIQATETSGDIVVIKVEILNPLTPQTIYQSSSGNSVVINAQVVPSGMTLNWGTDKPEFIGFADNQTSGTLWFKPGQGIVDNTNGTVVLEVKEPISGASAQCSIEYQAICRPGSVEKLPLSVHAGTNGNPSASGFLFLSYESEADKLNANYDWIINAHSPGGAYVSIVPLLQHGFPGPPVAKAAAGFYSKLGNSSEIHRACGVTSGSSSSNMTLSLGPLTVTVPLVQSSTLSNEVEHTNTASLQGSSLHSPTAQILKSMAVSLSTDYKTENCDNIYWSASIITNVCAYYAPNIDSKIVFGSPY